MWYPLPRGKKHQKLSFFGEGSQNQQRARTIWYGTYACAFLLEFYSLFYTNNSDDIKKEYAVQVFYTKNTFFPTKDESVVCRR